QYKELREFRRRKIDSSYKYIFEILSIKLGLDLAAVEELILDAPLFEAFDSFFAKGGSKALKIFYQEGEAPGVGKFLALLIQADVIPSCCITKNNSVSMQDIFSAVLDANERLPCGVRNMIENMFLPTVPATSNLDALSQNKQDMKDKQNFVEVTNSYLSFLKGCMIGIEGTVELKKIDYSTISKLQSLEEVTAAAHNPEMVRQLEEVLMIWCRQIEQVLVESKQIRKEAHDSGPLTELEHWRCMSAKFNFIIEQLKGPNCKAVISTLRVGRSRLLRIWQELDARVTYAANESKDNVKYLQTLEKVCQPFYSCDLVSVTHGIPKLINATRMIHNVSGYYNTSERMTSLFVKITNQMVTVCRVYITDSGLSHVWEQEKSTVMGKIKDCMFLLKEYQKCFQETKEILETSGEKVFGVSEMYIFGKSEAFYRRLEKIADVLTVVQTFSALSQSTIEGIDILAEKFENIYQNVQKKQCDILDPRKPEFDMEFLNFMAKIKDLETQIRTFMCSCFGKILSSQHALQLLQRFQNLRMPCLQEEIACTVSCILQHYVAELEATKKLYQIQKDNPPLARNMPPVAGKILWARQLFRRINEPINYFQKKSKILESQEGKAVVQLYNRIAYVLVEFEMVYHNAWMKEVSQLQYFLQATIFVRHPKTGKFLVNFDPQIPEIVRETKCMIKLGLEVPEQAIKIVKSENSLKSNKLRLEGLLRCYEELCQETPTIFVNLMTPKMNTMEAVLRRGLTMLTWSSMTLESFFQEAEQVLYMLKQVLKQVNDLSEMRIRVILKEISDTLLIVLPVGDAMKVEDMLTCNEAHTKVCAELLNQKSMHIEDTVQEIKSIFEKSYNKKTSEEHGLKGKEKHVMFRSNEEERENTSAALRDDSGKDNDKEDEFKKKCKEMVAFFNQELLDSLRKATRLSLDNLKRRIFVSKNDSVSPSKSEEVAAFLKAEVCLAIPNVVIVPSLDDIQQAINHLIQLILEVSRGVAQWGPKCLRKSSLKAESVIQQISSVVSELQGKKAKKWEKVGFGRKLRNFYSEVAEHEDVSNLVLLLYSSVNSIEELANEILQDFQKYTVLWTEDRDTKIQEFLASHPSLTEFKEEIFRYALFEEEVEDLKPIILLGPVELHTEPLKRALAIEARAWKMLLCRYLNEEYKKKMTDMMSFITEYLKKLSQPLCDLDDVRFAVQALSTIRENEIEMDMTLGSIE
ncbi:DYH8 protein, partial [Ceuthmochares aereus]|nr:DYH8 protein [Ceuthmochares aereus]